MSGPRRGRPTLAQIAELSGLSQSTVSRVLRGKASTSPAARDAVAGALRALGMEPPEVVLGGPAPEAAHTRDGATGPHPGSGAVGAASPPAAGPEAAHPEAAMSGSAQAAARPSARPAPARLGPRLLTVVSNALVGPDIDPYETVMLALNRRIFSLGHIALRSTSGLPGAGATDLETPLRERGVAGAVVLGGSHAGQEAVRLADAGIPVVRISNARHVGLPQFVLDASSGIATAVRHLVAMGHRRIGFAAVKNSAADERISAFRREIAQSLHVQATRAEAPVAVAGPGLLAGAQAAEQLLDRGCTAAISSSPALTLGFLEATERARLRMPDDFSLLTVGDIPDADVLDPPMSQVTYDWASLAESAVAELLRIVADREAGADPGEPANYAVVPDLVLRDSVRPVRRR
ncbi:MULTISPECIES: LacI family DNA-binding transcriptional regulator [Brevibacterium]|uniref:LacI family transcriptional regulator n=1 Tax=Brevibacterium salitolerans TaxID=1403566 RepID=A0ABP5I6B6_9MICO|nr:LacI family DNA-binding transcriptional regulator [Brevibacterium sp.]